MIRIKNITNEETQRHTILLGESEVTITLKYFDFIKNWMFDVEYKKFKLHNMCLVLGTLHMKSANQPFDFIAEDTSGKKIGPCDIEDFASGRIEVYMLEPEDMIKVRNGAKVPV